MTRLERRGTAVALAGTAAFAVLLFFCLRCAKLPCRRPDGELSVSIAFVQEQNRGKLIPGLQETVQLPERQAEPQPVQPSVPLKRPAPHQSESQEIEKASDCETDVLQELNSLGLATGHEAALQETAVPAEENAAFGNAPGMENEEHDVPRAGSGILMQDKSFRQLLEPAEISIRISEKNARLVKSTRSALIRLKILADGTVPLDGISCVPSSQLPVQIQNEIKEQVCRWKFSKGTEGTASFQYTLEIEY